MSIETYEQMLRWRGVETACRVCAGSGVRAYGSTATWHGGIGGASITSDVCDRCWGSGDANRHGMDLRALTATRAKWEDDQTIEFLACRLGVGIGDIRNRVMDLACMCDKEAKRRKVPGGQDGFWWRHTWTALGSILRRLAQK